MYPGMVPENPCFCCWGQTEVTSIRNTYIDIKVVWCTCCESMLEEAMIQCSEVIDLQGKKWPTNEFLTINNMLSLLLQYSYREKC